MHPIPVSRILPGAKNRDRNQGPKFLVFLQLEQAPWFPDFQFPGFFLTLLPTCNKSFNLLRLNYLSLSLSLFFFFFLILNLLHYYQAKNISNTKDFIISYPWWEIWMGRRVFEIKSKKVVKECKPKESLTK
jgi:hypothetical protein